MSKFTQSVIHSGLRKIITALLAVAMVMSMLTVVNTNVAAADGSVVDTATVGAGKTYTFADRLIMNGDKEITYTVQEKNNDYTGKMNFTLEPVAKTHFHVRNFWDSVPTTKQIDTVKFTIYQSVDGGDPTAVEGYQDITLTKDDLVYAEGNAIGWSKEFDLPKETEDGKAITYSVVENADEVEANSYTVTYDKSTEQENTYQVTGTVTFTPYENITATEDKPITISYKLTKDGETEEKIYKITSGTLPAGVEYSIDIPLFETADNNSDYDFTITSISYETQELESSELRTEVVYPETTKAYIKATFDKDISTNNFIAITYIDEYAEEHTIKFKPSTKIVKGEALVELPDLSTYEDICQITGISYYRDENNKVSLAEEDFEDSVIYGGYVTVITTPDEKLEKDKYTAEVRIVVYTEDPIYKTIEITGNHDANKEISTTVFVELDSSYAGNDFEEVAVYSAKYSLSTAALVDVTRTIGEYQTSQRKEYKASEDVDVLEIHHAVSRQITVDEIWNFVDNDDRPEKVYVTLTACDSEGNALDDHTDYDQTLVLDTANEYNTTVGVADTDEDGETIYYTVSVWYDTETYYTRDLVVSEEIKADGENDATEADSPSEAGEEYVVEYLLQPAETQLTVSDTPFFTIVHVPVTDATVEEDDSSITVTDQLGDTVSNKVSLNSTSNEYDLLTADDYDRDAAEVLYAGQYTDETLDTPLGAKEIVGEDYGIDTTAEVQSGNSTIEKDVEVASCVHPRPGQTYYVKELSRSYLRTRTITTWWYPDEDKPEEGNQIVEARMLTWVDNENYLEVGFDYSDITATRSDGQTVTPATNTSSEELDVSFILDVPYEGKWEDQGDEETKEAYKVSDMNTGVHGLFAVRSLPVQLPDNSEDPMNDSGNPDAVDYAKFSATPFYKTYDGVRVSGDTIRTVEYKKYTDDYGKDASNLTLVSDVKTSVTNVYSNDVTYSAPMKVMSCYTLMSYHPETYTVTVEDGETSTAVETRGGDVTAQMPAGKAGYRFAGFYSDAAYKNAADLSNVTADVTVYAKYVSEDYLGVNYKETKSRKAVTSVKFVSAVDGKNYTEQGFMISVNGNESTYKCKSLTAMVSGFTVKKLVANATRGSKLFSYSLNTKGYADGTVIQVTPYWITKDGTKVTGETAEYTYYKSGLTK